MGPLASNVQQIRCAGGHDGPLRPINDNFPLTSEKTMGPHGFMRGSYTILSLKNPIRGPLYRPPWVVGGIHNPTMDPERQFNQQDRFLTVSAFEYLKFLMYPMMGVRVQFFMAFIPTCCVLFIVWLEHRREPMEIFMDR